MMRAIILIAMWMGSRASADDRVEALLEAVWKTPVTRLFDSHGNASRELQELMKLRYGATPNICQRIAAGNLSDHRKHIGAFYWVLGVVKDPSSIDWIRSELKSPRRNLVIEYWLRAWYQPSLISLGPKLHWAQRWIDGRDQWAQMLREEVVRVEPEARSPFLMAILARCHDSQTIQFVKSMAGDSADLTQVDSLALQTYLFQHEQEFDDVLVAGLVEDLDTTKGGRPTWMAYARATRHEVFLSKCIDIANVDASAREIAGLIACNDVDRSASQWIRWHRENGDEGRSKWLQDARRRCEASIKARPEKAEEIVGNSRWLQSPDCLGILKQWSTEGWAPNSIVLTVANMYVPAQREKIKVVVDEVLKRSRRKLTAESLKVLHDLEFNSEAEPLTWVDYVSTMNSMR